LLQQSHTNESPVQNTEVSNLCRAAISLTQYLRTWTAVLEAPLSHIERFEDRYPQGGHFPLRSVAQSQCLELGTRRVKLVLKLESQSLPGLPQACTSITLDFAEPTASPIQVLRHRLDFFNHEVFSRMYSKIQAPLEWAQIDNIVSELELGCSIAVNEATPDWIYKVNKATWQREKTRVSVALSYHGLRMLLTRPHLRYGKAKGSKPLSSHSCQAVSMCFDSACRIINLLPEIPSLQCLMLLPCWWFNLPYVSLAAKVIVDNALFKSICCQLLPRDAKRLLPLAERWLNSLNSVQGEAEGLSNKPTYKLFGTAVSAVAMSEQKSPNVLPGPLQTNNESHGGRISVNLSSNSQESASVAWTRDPLPVTASDPEPSTAQPHKPPLSLSSNVQRFQEYLGLTIESYRVMMVSSLASPCFVANIN
jgi:hypothetical protein